MDYIYRASILQDGYTTIYFKSFIQEGNTIEIDSGYAVGDEVHWLDFDSYDIHDSPLTITLTDNAGKFVYYDRVKKITYNENMGASQ